MTAHQHHLVAQKLSAVRREISESDLSPEHKDALQSKMDDAVRILDADGSADESPSALAAAVRELRAAHAERIGYDVRQEVRAGARTRQVVYSAVTDAVSKAIDEALKRHKLECPVAGANAAGLRAPVSLADEIAAVAAVPWAGVWRMVALRSPSAVAVAVAAVCIALVIHGFGPRLLAWLSGGGAV
jgi:hypothetical protein